MLLFNDLHLADLDSIQSLSRLAQELENVPVLLAAAYRDSPGWAFGNSPEPRNPDSMCCPGFDKESSTKKPGQHVLSGFR
ncbi:MAG: hypothetical protein QF570_17955 [Myxococcota bacterium]|nr:hypothetical protein [Myxococcota bacterium]